MTRREQAEPVVRKARRDEAGRVGDVLGEAFHDDPVVSWFLRQDRRRLRAVRNTFWCVARFQYMQHDLVFLSEDGAGAAAWLPPGVRSDPPPLRAYPILLAVILASAGLRRMRRVFQVQDLLRRVHPKEPHYYLWAVGVRPGHQGRGIGSALIREVTARCDREGVPAYLENSKRENLLLYERLGFRVTSEERLGADGPSIWCMWREPDGA